jgi:hypothetical protein
MPYSKKPAAKPKRDGPPARLAKKIAFGRCIKQCTKHTCCVDAWWEARNEIVNRHFM